MHNNKQEKTTFNTKIKVDLHSLLLKTQQRIISSHIWLEKSQSQQDNVVFHTKKIPTYVFRLSTLLRLI
jgi:hypothetical protein